MVTQRKYVFTFYDALYSFLNLFFKQALKDIYLKAVPAKHFDPAEYIYVEDTPITFIDRSIYHLIIQLAEYDSVSLNYPLALHARKYISLIEEDSEIEKYLLFPSATVISFLQSDLYPYTTFYNFLNYESRKNAIVICRDYTETKLNMHGMEIDYGDYIGELMKRKETTLSIFIKDINNSTPHNCHHQDCKYYIANLCRRWNAIPKVKEYCSFPSWFASEYNYEINLETKILHQINTEESNVYKKMYADLISKAKYKRRFQFIKQGNIFIFDIPKRVIDEKRVTYFSDIINFLQTDYKLTYDDLFDNIVLDFKSFANDSKEVFEILSVRDWFHELYKAIPYFFFYLHLSEKYNQLFNLMPIFLPYHKKVEGVKILIKFDAYKQLNFITQQVINVQEFTNESGLDSAHYCLLLTKALTKNYNL